MQFTFSNPLFEWRGLSPFYFVEIPQEVSDEIKIVAKELSYGWGVIPVTAEIEGTVFTTSLFPKDGAYLLPMKDAVRKATKISKGDLIEVALDLGRTK